MSPTLRASCPVPTLLLSDGCPGVAEDNDALLLDEFEDGKVLASPEADASNIPEAPSEPPVRDTTGANPYTALTLGPIPNPHDPGVYQY